MNLEDINLFPVCLTALVTVATCIISEHYGRIKMRIEKFQDIYACLAGFTDKRAAIVEQCNKMADELAESLPEKWDKKSSKKWMDKYRDTYHGMNKIIAEYSKFLDLFLSFSHFLGKSGPFAPALHRSKPAIHVIKTECWSILNLYEQIVTMENGHQTYGINYSQIVSIAQFIRTEGKRKDRKKLAEYLKRNHVSEFPL